MYRKQKLVLMSGLLVIGLLAGCKKQAPEPVETSPAIGFGQEETVAVVEENTTDYDVLKETQPQEDLDRIVKETEPEIELASEDADIFNTVAILNYNKTSLPVVYNYDVGLLSGVNIISTVLNFDTNGFNNEKIDFELFDSDNKSLVKEEHDFKSTHKDEKDNVITEYQQDSYKYINKYLSIVDEYAKYLPNVGYFEIKINYIAPDSTPMTYVCHVDLGTNVNYEILDIPYTEDMPMKFGAKPMTMHDYFEDLGTQIKDNYREKRGDRGYTEINIVKDVKTEKITNEKTGEVKEETVLTPVNLEYRVSYPVYNFNVVEDTALNYIYSGEKYSTDSAVVGDLFNRFAYVNYLGHNFHLSNLLSEQYLGDYGNMITVASKLRDEGFEAYRVECDALNLHTIEYVKDSNEMKSVYEKIMQDKNADSRYCISVLFREANSPDYILKYSISGVGDKLYSVEIALEDISDRYADMEKYKLENSTIKVTNDGVSPSNLKLNALKGIQLQYSDADRNYKYATSNTFRFFIVYSDTAIKEMQLKRFFGEASNDDSNEEDVNSEETQEESGEETVEEESVEDASIEETVTESKEIDETLESEEGN